MRKSLHPFALSICLFAFTSSANLFAQASNQKSEIKIKVEKEINGKKITEERIIDTAGMSEKQQQAALDQVQKEMLGKDFANQRVKISIEKHNQQTPSTDDLENDFEWRSDNETDFNDQSNGQVDVYRFKNGKDPKVIIKKRGFDNEDFDWDSEAWEQDFERSMHNLQRRLQYLGDEIPRRIEQNTPIYRWDNQLFEGKSAPLKSVDVYPNRPNTHVLNVRFFAPNEGEVTIKVLDINGNTVAKETVANFKGEYVGQLELAKNSTGTFFVIISQGTDGISRRVVLE